MTHSNTEQPKNSITLMNGAVLECFPKESHQDDFVPDKMKLDATGTYLRMSYTLSQVPSGLKRNQVVVMIFKVI